MSNAEKSVNTFRYAKGQMRGLQRVLRILGAVASACLLLACVSSSPPSDSPPIDPHPRVASEHHTVALLGATGMMGKFLLQEMLARGYSVRALARTPAKLAEYSGRIAIVKGDARDPLVIEELLRGSDVVISALGPVRADGDANLFINTIVTGNVLQTMKAQGISKYMVVSGAGVVMPGDERNVLGWWIRTLAQIGLRDALEDKQAEYGLLANSTADWVLVRCPIIDPAPLRQTALVSLQTPPAFRVRSGEVAHFMIDQIDSANYRRQGPFLGSD
jgi:NAD(P)H-binding